MSASFSDSFTVRFNPVDFIDRMFTLSKQGLIESSLTLYMLCTLVHSCALLLLHKVAQSISTPLEYIDCNTNIGLGTCQEAPGAGREQGSSTTGLIGSCVFWTSNQPSSRFSCNIRLVLCQLLLHWYCMNIRINLWTVSNVLTVKQVYRIPIQWSLCVLYVMLDRWKIVI